MKWFLQGFKKYAVFNGRARREEYWMFHLFSFLSVVAVLLIDMFIGASGYLYILYILVLIIPSIAVGVRRLHDVGKSGWFYLIIFIPFIGAVWLLALFITEGNAETNKYGPNPKPNEDMEYIQSSEE